VALLRHAHRQQPLPAPPPFIASLRLRGANRPDMTRAPRTRDNKAAKAAVSNSWQKTSHRARGKGSGVVIISKINRQHYKRACFARRAE